MYLTVSHLVETMIHTQQNTYEVIVRQYTQINFDRAKIKCVMVSSTTIIWDLLYQLVHKIGNFISCYIIKCYFCHITLEEGILLLVYPEDCLKQMVAKFLRLILHSGHKKSGNFLFVFDVRICILF